MNIEQFAEELRQEVLSRGNDEETGHFREDAFTEVMIEYLAQANEVDEGEICYHKNGARDCLDLQRAQEGQGVARESPRASEAHRS